MSVEVMEKWPEIRLDQYPVLPGDTQEVICLKQNAREVARIINTTMPELERKICELNLFKKEYDGRNSFLKWWDNDVMEEKRNEMIAVTMNSSDCQLKVVRFIAFLNVILNEQQKVLSATQVQMQAQAATIEKQQRDLLAQNGQLASHQKKMEADNRAIIEGCQILQKLRNAVVEHDQKIEEQGESLTGIDKLIVELRNLYKDFETYQRKIEKRIDTERDKLSLAVTAIDKKSATNISQVVVSFKEDLTGQIGVLKDEVAQIRCSANHRLAMVASLAAVSLLGLIGICLYMVFR